MFSNERATLFYNPWSVLCDSGVDRDVVFPALLEEFHKESDDFESQRVAFFKVPECTVHSLPAIKERLLAFAQLTLSLPKLQAVLAPDVRQNNTETLDGLNLSFIEIGSDCIAIRDKTQIRNLIIVDNSSISFEQAANLDNSYKWFTTGSIPSEEQLKELTGQEKALFDYSAAISKSERLLQSQNHRSCVYTIVLHTSRDLATIIYVDRSGVSVGGPFQIQDGTFLAYHLLISMVALEYLLPLVFHPQGPQFQLIAIKNASATPTTKRTRLQDDEAGWAEHFLHDAPVDGTFYPEHISSEGPHAKTREVVLFDNTSCNNIWERVYHEEPGKPVTKTFQQSSWELLAYQARTHNANALAFFDPYETEAFDQYLKVQRVLCKLPTLPPDAIKSAVDFHCQAIQQTLGTRLRSEHVAWARVNRTFTFLPVPAAAYMTQSASDSEMRELLIKSFHDILLNQPPGDENHNGGESISCLASPYTCMIVQEDNTTSETWSYVSPVHTRHPISLDIMRFAAASCMLNPSGDPAVAVSVAYTLLYTAFVDHPDIEPWKNSMSLETICRTRNEFIEKVFKGKCKPSAGWSDVCRSSGWIAMIKALQNGESMKRDTVREWLEDMLKSVKELTAGGRTNQLGTYKDLLGAHRSYVVLTTRKRRRSDNHPTSHSAASLSVPALSGTYSRYSSQESQTSISHSGSLSSISPHNSYSAITPTEHYSLSELPNKQYANTDGNLGKGMKRPQRAKTEDQLTAFDRQMCMPYEVIPPFPVTLPLDHPEAFRFYTDLIYGIPADEEFKAILRKPYDKDEALAKYSTRPTDRHLKHHKKEEQVAQIFNAIISYLHRRWGSYTIFEITALSAIKFHSDGEIRPGKDSLKTEEGVVPDIFMTYKDCTFRGKSRYMKQLSYSHMIAVGERQSLPRRKDDLPFRKVFLYSRRILAAQPTRHGVFGFYIDAVPKESTSSSHRPVAAGGDGVASPLTTVTTETLPQIVLPEAVMSLIFALVYYDREGQSKSETYSVEDHPSKFLSHLLLLTGIFHFKHLWDFHQSILAAGCLPNCYVTDGTLTDTEREQDTPVIAHVYGIAIGADQRIAAHHFGIFGRATNIWKADLTNTILKATYASLPIGERSLEALPDELACHIVLSSDNTAWQHLCEAKKVVSSKRTDTIRGVFGMLSPEPRMLSHFQLDRFGTSLFEETHALVSMIGRGENQASIDEKKKGCFAALRDGLKGWSALQDRGYLHGDISPLNIMVARDGGNNFLIDLGLALPTKGGFRKPSGTPDYIASRILSNEHGQICLYPRDDLESFLWVLLFVVATLTCQSRPVTDFFLERKSGRTFAEIHTHRSRAFTVTTNPFARLLPKHGVETMQLASATARLDSLTSDAKDYFQACISNTGGSGYELSKSIVLKTIKDFRALHLPLEDEHDES